MSLPFHGILVTSFICNLSAKNRNKSLFWWQRTWLFRDLKTCFVFSYVILAEDVNMPFFQAFVLSSSSQMNACTDANHQVGLPLSERWRQLPCGPFSSLIGEIWALQLRLLIFLLISHREGSIQVFSWRSACPARVSYHFPSLCILGPATGLLMSPFV